MREPFSAYIMTEPPWLGPVPLVRLHLREGLDRRRWLRRDGSWQDEVGEGTAVAQDDLGILLPAEAVEAIALAIDEWQGHTSHADTEARVLREWLTIERNRVDDVLAERRP